MSDKHILYCESQKQETGKGFWQCGMWVKTKREATIYPSYNEAMQVCLYRTLPTDTVAQEV